MSKYAIDIQNIGKKYHIAARKQSSDTLASSLIGAVKRPVQRVANLLRGNTTGAADLDQDFWALRGVSFNVEHGETVGVIGRNGAGKSTLLKLLSRITYPSEGQAIINGRVGSLLEVGTGFNFELTGRENIYLNGSIMGMTTTEISNKFDEIVEFAGVGNFVDTPVKHYSSGMTVRLAFAVAAHLEPEILLVDEVLAVGDYAFQKKSLGKMQDVTQSGRTVLFVSHQLDMVREICDRVVLLKDGQVAMIGETNHVIDTYIEAFSVTGENVQFESELLPDLPHQLIAGRILNSNGELCSLFDVFEPITIELEYLIRAPMSGTIVNCTLNRNDEPIFLTFDTDTVPERLNNRKPGYFKTRFTIPSPLLKDGYYSVDTAIGIAFGRGENRHRLNNSLKFEVALTSKSGSLLSYEKIRKGKLALNLDWMLEETSKTTRTE